jgi:hypothetical protein
LDQAPVLQPIIAILVILVGFGILTDLFDERCETAGQKSMDGMSRRRLPTQIDFTRGKLDLSVEII